MRSASQSLPGRRALLNWAGPRNPEMQRSRREVRIWRDVHSMRRGSYEVGRKSRFACELAVSLTLVVLVMA